jgi:hypothetical protein
MLAPLEVELPSGLRISMDPRPARYKWWIFGIAVPEETREELLARFTAALDEADFDAIRKVHGLPRAKMEQIRKPQSRAVAVVQRHGKTGTTLTLSEENILKDQ